MFSLPVTVTHALALAEIKGAVSESTGKVVTLNATEFWPGATVTLAGTIRSAEVLDRFTTRPPMPAFAVNVTRPCKESPPITLFRERLSEPTQGAVADGLMVSGAEALFADVAVMVAVVVEDTSVVLIGKVTDVAP